MGVLCSRNARDQCLPFMHDQSYYEATRPKRRVISNISHEDSNSQVESNHQRGTTSPVYYDKENNQITPKEPKKLRLAYHKYFDKEDIKDSNQNYYQRNIQIDSQSFKQDQVSQREETKIERLGSDNEYYGRRSRNDQGTDYEPLNTIENRIWDENTESIIYGGKDNMLMELNNNGRQTPSMFLRSKMLQSFQEILQSKEDVDDYHEDLKLILREMDSYFDKRNQILYQDRTSPMPLLPHQMLERANTKKDISSQAKYSTAQVPAAGKQNIKRTKTMSTGSHKSLNRSRGSNGSTKAVGATVTLLDKIKFADFKREIDFITFLEQQAASQLNFGAVASMNSTLILFESKIYRQPQQNSKALIDRFLRLDQKNIYCYSKEVEIAQYKLVKPLFTIPIDSIKQIEYQQQNKNSRQQKLDKNQKQFFKITLDGPLQERKTTASRKTAVSDRRIEGDQQAFKDCNVDNIEVTDHDNSDIFNTIILNNDEDMKSELFEDEASTFLKMSQSIRQMKQGKGFNSQKGDYYEIFEIGCENEQICKKWVIIIKWLIRKQLIALS